MPRVCAAPGRLGGGECVASSMPRRIRRGSAVRAAADHNRRIPIIDFARTRPGRKFVAALGGLTVLAMLMLAASTAAAALAAQRGPAAQQAPENPYAQEVEPTTAPAVTFGRAVLMNRSHAHVPVNCLAPKRVYCIGVLSVKWKRRTLASDVVSLKRGAHVVRLRLRRSVRRQLKRVTVQMRVYGADGTIRTVKRSLPVR